MKAGDLRSSVGLQAQSGDLDKMNLRDRDGVKMSRLYGEGQYRTAKKMSI